MRKLIVLLVAVAILGAGYTAYWHRKADAFREMFTQSVDSLNEQAKPFTKDLPFFHYDAVQVTGFPFAMVIEASKPVVNLPVSALIEQVPDHRAMAAAARAPYEWVEEISYGDKITLTGNIMGDHYTLTASGDRTDKSLINRSARHTLVSSTSTPYVCHLGVERPTGGTPWTMQPIFTDLKTFLSIFRSLDCDTRDIALKDAASGAVLLTSDGVSFAATNEASAGINHRITFLVNSEKTKTTPAFDALYTDYLLMAYTLMGKADQLVSPIPPSENGEQNIKADLRYDGPTTLQAFTDPEANFHVDINTLDLQSALGTLSLEMHLGDVPQGNDRSLSFALHEKMNVTEHNDQLSQKYLAALLANMARHPDSAPADPVAQSLQKLAMLGAPEQVVAKLYPQLHTFGKASLDIDFNVKGPNQDAKFLKQGIAMIDTFNLLTEPYGIKVKGSSNASTAGKPLTADFSLTCLACDALVSDFGNYLMRVESVVNQVSSPPRPTVLSKDLFNGLTQFLHGISENSSAKDLVIHFVMKDSGPTISGKQIQEVIGLYMSTVAPYLPKPAPAQPPIAQPGQ
jgi:hypothetical protein